MEDVNPLLVSGQSLINNFSIILAAFIYCLKVSSLVISGCDPLCSVKVNCAPSYFYGPKPYRSVKSSSLSALNWLFETIVEHVFTCNSIGNCVFLNVATDFCS